MSVPPKTHFNKYHQCEILVAQDPFLQLVPGDDFLQRFYRRFRTYWFVNQDSLFTRYFLKSRTAILNDIARQMDHAPWTIHPFSRINHYWDILMLITYLIAFVLQPYEFTFEISDSNVKVFHYVHFIFLLDIIVQFRSGFYDFDNDKIIMDQKSITLKYLKGTLWVDVVSSLPQAFLVVVQRDNCPVAIDTHLTCPWQIVNLMTVIKFLRLPRFFAIIENNLKRLDKRPYVFKIIKMIFIVFFIIHWATCLEFMVVLFAFTDHGVTPEGPNSWTAEFSFWGLPPYDKYIHCFHRALYTLAIFGHSMNDSKTVEDMCLSLFLLIIGFIMKIYLLAQAFMLVKMIYSSTSKFEENRYQLKDYMRHEKLPHDIQTRILSYYDYSLQKSYYKEKPIYLMMGSLLKYDVKVQLGSKLVMSVPCFAKLPVEVINKICIILKSEIYLHNDVVFKQSQQVQVMYFVVSGTVALYTSSGREVSHVEDGGHFGELSLFFDSEKSPLNVVAVEISELYALYKSDFLEIMNGYQELFMEIKKGLTELLKSAKYQHKEEIEMSLKTKKPLRIRKDMS